MTGPSELADATATIAIVLKKMTEPLELADTATSAKGQESCRLKRADGSDIFYYSAAAGLRAPRGPFNFDKGAPATRLDLEVRRDDPDALAFIMSSTPGLSVTSSCAQRRSARSR